MIQSKIKLAIMRHTEEDYPKECCGVITQKGRVQRYHRIENISSKPELHFEMNEQQYHDALECGDIVAIVHSHPGDGASTIPSAHDSCVCNEMQVPWVITSWPEGDMRIVEPQEVPLIGRPWALGSYDCWGLIMAWHEQQGIKLNDFRKPYEWWKGDNPENLYEDNYLKEGFIPTGKEPEPGDMIIFKLQSSVWNHAGIYLGDNQVLHHTFGRLSRKDIYSGWLQDNAVMVCRHKDLGGINE